VNATLGFGRSHVAPLISRFVRKHPQVEVQLQLSVNPPPLTDDSFDVCIRFGAPPDARVIARHIAPNRRLLCAAPAYLARTAPKVPHDLDQAQLHRHPPGRRGLRRVAADQRPRQGRDHRGGQDPRQPDTNDGEIAVNWALDGHGILMRAEWDSWRTKTPSCATPSG
jgi:LysR family transcriptional activator of dmlA